MKLAIVTFLFSQPRKWIQLGYSQYGPRHVNALWRGCLDNIKIPHRFIAYTDKPDGIECERRPMFPRVRIAKPDGISVEDGCYSRLRLYDPDIQAELGADFVMILDLDLVFMSDATELIERAMAHDFAIMQGSRFANGSLCNYYNGSIQLCRSGARPQFWRDFDTRKFWQQREAFKMPNRKRPKGTDQAWFCVSSGACEHTIGPDDGVYQYRTLGGKIPDNTRILLFSGRAKPWQADVRRRNPDVYAAWHRYDCD